MKVYVFLAAFMTILITAPSFAAEEKIVCRDKITQKGEVVRGKDGKPVQECKKIKVHKKLEGTKVPEKK